MHLRMRVLYRCQVRTFIEKQCFASHKLVVCNYIKGGEPTVSRDEWAWQPLDFTHPTNDQRFELPLRWDNGTIGLFTVECGIFTPMDEELITLLHTVARMLEDAIKDLEDLELGTKPPLYTAIDVLEVYEKRKRDIAKILADELSTSVKTSPIFTKSFVETAAYCKKVEDADTRKLMQALLSLAGHNSNNWNELRKHLGNVTGVVDALADADMLTSSIADTVGKGLNKRDADKGSSRPVHKRSSSKHLKLLSRWNVAEAYLKGVDLNDLYQDAPTPAKILIRWFKMARIVHNIGVAMAIPDDETFDAQAQTAFDQIDSNGDGMISVEELIEFCLDEYGPEGATKLLRVIDSDGSDGISQAEWHRAWRKGDFSVEEVSERPSGVGPSKSVRIMSKHLQQASSSSEVVSSKTHGASAAAESAPARSRSVSHHVKSVGRATKGIARRTMGRRSSVSGGHHVAGHHGKSSNPSHASPKSPSKVLPAAMGDTHISNVNGDAKAQKSVRIEDPTAGQKEAGPSQTPSPLSRISKSAPAGSGPGASQLPPLAANSKSPVKDAAEDGNSPR